VPIEDLRRYPCGGFLTLMLGPERGRRSTFSLARAASNCSWPSRRRAATSAERPECAGFGGEQTPSYRHTNPPHTRRHTKTPTMLLTCVQLHARLLISNHVQYVTRRASGGGSRIGRRPCSRVPRKDGSHGRRTRLPLGGHREGPMLFHPELPPRRPSQHGGRGAERPPRRHATGVAEGAQRPCVDRMACPYGWEPLPRQCIRRIWRSIPCRATEMTQTRLPETLT
jgi:hypothetical protein